MQRYGDFGLIPRNLPDSCRSCCDKGMRLRQNKGRKPVESEKEMTLSKKPVEHFGLSPKNNLPSLRDKRGGGLNQTSGLIRTIPLF